MDAPLSEGQAGQLGGNGLHVRLGFNITKQISVGVPKIKGRIVLDHLVFGKRIAGFVAARSTQTAAFWRGFGTAPTPASTYRVPTSSLEIDGGYRGFA